MLYSWKKALLISLGFVVLIIFAGLINSTAGSVIAVLFTLFYLYSLFAVPMYHYRKHKEKKNTQELGVPDGAAITITTSKRTTNSHQQTPPKGKIQKAGGDAWIINPKSTFPLTLYGINEEIALQLTALLDRAVKEGQYEVSNEILAIVARHNVGCKEIDAFLDKYRKIYLDKIEELKSSSDEWDSASDLDREDMLAEFQEKAMELVDVRPDCDLHVLFNFQQSDIKIDDELIERYGLNFVLDYLDYGTKVQVVSVDDDERKAYEKYIKDGFAIRGKDIEPEFVLETLTIKEMIALVSDLNPPKFGRRVKAIEFLREVPDLKERLSKKVRMRELFQLKPFKGEFSDDDFVKISESIRYSKHIARLIRITYVCAHWAIVNKYRNLEQKEYYDGWEIDCRCGEDCAYCTSLAEKQWSRSKYPTVPFHIGCRCSVHGA